ncbi:MAG: DUF2938 domain-containing protein [Rheinheimera sp.]|nr:DUF2938 domain-containing protein [Rheinheimera sp.]
MDTLLQLTGAALVLGIGATALLDLWSLLLNKGFGVKSLSFCLVGRWFALMRHGQFRHNGIGKAPAQSGECALGWTAHYAIGVVFAVPLLWWQGGQWLAAPTLAPALILGAVTVLMPFLLMQPAFGLGVAAAKTPAPWQARLKSLSSHLMFGLGLYVSALLYSSDLLTLLPI